MSKKKDEDIIGYALEHGNNCVTTPDGALMVVPPTRLHALRQHYPNFKVMAVYFWDVMTMLPTGAEYFLSKWAVDKWNEAMRRYKKELEGFPGSSVELSWPEGSSEAEGGILLRVPLPPFVRERLRSEIMAMMRAKAPRAAILARVVTIYLEIGMEVDAAKATVENN